MSCEVAAPAGSPFAESIFEEEWKKCTGDDAGVLDTIAQFNAGFRNDFVAGSNASGGVDPQLLSNASSPAATPNNTIKNDETDIDELFNFDQVQSSAYPEVNNPVSTATAATPPYYHQSIETGTSHNNNPHPYHPSPLYHQYGHRRSVSEPPGGHPTPQEQNITFHRQGHLLGTPSMKSTTRAKGHRRHPYLPLNAPASAKQQMRRTQTQQSAQLVRAPTSTPHQMMAPTQSYHPRNEMIPPQRLTGPFVSSRVCTPSPEPPVRMDPTSIDPALARPPGQQYEERKPTVAIPLAVEELKDMITEAVQKAVEAIEAAKGGVGVRKVETEVTDEEGHALLNRLVETDE